MRQIKIYDTTLRDGAQGEGISFSVEDKIFIAQKLDQLGVHYIEGGWPGSNPKDMDFFRQIKNLPFRSARISAFGSTRRTRFRVEEDPNLRALLETGMPVVTVFGKSWDLHVRDVLRITPEENLKIIFDSVSYLKGRVEEVIFDAEHFFDGFKSNSNYALATLKAAWEAGADCLVLCDTNGGTLPSEVQVIIYQVQKEIAAPLGIHVHNDADTAVASTLMAVEAGVNHVQGTINGYGERCGNANLCSIIPNLKLKLKLECIPDSQLPELTKVARYVSEVANLIPRDDQPYVGKSAFAHKGGMHVDAVRKTPVSFEHVPPELVGNRRRILVSELSGTGAVLDKAQEYNLPLTKDSPETEKILEALKQREFEGYQFEGAEASFELLMKKTLGKHRTFFDLEGFRVIVEKKGKRKCLSEATIQVWAEGVKEHTAAEGEGPVNALDNALRKALEKFYPQLKEVRLTDFKVRVLDAKTGTAAKVRVLIESSDHRETWSTVGVSENIIEASWEALVDGIEYKLLKEEESPPR